MLKASQIWTKRAAFSTASMSRTPARDWRLVGDDADDVAVEPGQRADDVGGPARVDLEVLAVVDDLLDHLAHVVGAVASAGTRSSSGVVAAVGRVVAGWWRAAVSRLFGGQQRQEVADLLEALCSSS